MRAKIAAVRDEYVNVGGASGHGEAIRPRYDVELVVTSATESRDQLIEAWRGDVEYRLVPVNDLVPVVRMGGLSLAFYHANDDEPDAYLIPVPEEQ